MSRHVLHQWMDENVLFFLEVKAFKMAGGGEATYLTYIKRMHDIYIAPGSLREVGTSSYSFLSEQK